MLVGWKRKWAKFWLQKVFLDFNNRVEEGHGTITSTQISWFNGLWTGVIVACFQMAGILQWLSERWKRWVRNWSPRGPTFLRWCMLRPSGPIAAVFSNLRNNIRRVAGYRFIKRKLLKQLPLDNPVGRGWLNGGFIVDCQNQNFKF